MILQRLSEAAPRLIGEERATPPGWDWRPVPWVIRLSAAGELLGVVPTADGTSKKGKPRIVPCSRRTSGVFAHLVTDKREYVLGMPERNAKTPERRQAYRDLLDACIAETHALSLCAIRSFLVECDAGRITEGDLPADMTDGDLVAFEVEGEDPTELPAVRAFWSGHTGSNGSNGDGPVPETTCLVCGERREIPEKLPIAHKRIPEAQTSGAALVSINARAFESYGLSRAKTSSVCTQCGERFGKALNHLLEDELAHVRVGPVVYVFWTREGADHEIAPLLQHPDPDAVRRLLEGGDLSATLAANAPPDPQAVRRTFTAPFTGRAGAEGQDDAFFAVGLSAAQSRVVVRDWLETTIGHARAHLARWFRLLGQVDAWGEEQRPSGVFRLAACLYRDANKEMVAHVPQSLIRSALYGDRIPEWILAQAVDRCRAERDVTAPRAALMKAALVDGDQEDPDTMSSLETNGTRPAYQCGRLLAVLEQVQKAAIPEINATIVDRYYGAASSAPITVFGTLLGDAQNHLGKLRKSHSNAHGALENRLEDILEVLPAFPNTLTLKEQAEFALGFYHQRAEDRRRMIVNAAAKRAGNGSSTESTSETEEGETRV